MSTLKHIISPIHLMMVAWLCCSIGFMAQQAQADDGQMPIPMQIDIKNGVVYCSAGPISHPESIQHALQEGTPISFRWSFTIDKISSYWINQHIGTVSVKRQVIPDLISRTWILKDDSSGIEKRVFSLVQAMQFLLQIEHFPVLDQSLLPTDNTFLMLVDVFIDEGSNTNTSWWQDMIRFDSINITQEFALP